MRRSQNRLIHFSSLSINQSSDDFTITHSNEIDELIRHIPINESLKFLIYDIVQTQDIFFIGFQPECNEADISIYEFRNIEDIYSAVREELKKLRIDSKARNNILINIKDYANEIEDNVKFFGGARIFDC
ncbi:hypothetical protein NMY3_00377 [Candidatus Nitrosocosmicus oleophilus]|uniref:Uncharacterized protein n=1 Tax=Candidatus Nitrosocosmicus oleophilus TaxID=1353260 RepID=A0A654LWG7_9ARCH|nr:hypothetical protein NMY3_00377 [Candidatus Nitrosocosmicus oleophilus]